MKYWLLNTEHKSAAYDVARNVEELDMTLSATARFDAAAGDGVLLWRGGRGGGVVSIGEITKTANLPSSELTLLRMRRHGSEKSLEPDPLRVTLEFERLMFSTPLTSEALQGAGFQHVAKLARATNPTFDLKNLTLTGHEWEELNRLCDQAQQPASWPVAWNITPGSVVRRAELHEVYGGNPLVTASSSGKTPNAFLFLRNDQADGRSPQWDGTSLMAIGHGQDLRSPSTENLAVLAHRRRGAPLRVFISEKTESLYIGEFAIDSKQPIHEWISIGERTYRRDTRKTRVVKAPIFRLQQLSGVPIGAIDGIAFRSAPRIRLSLHASSDRQADVAVRRLLTLLEREPDIAASLGELHEAQVLTAIVQRSRRQADLNELRAAVEDPGSNENDLQKLIQRMTWIFGSEFDPGTVRRNLTLRDQLDLALLRPDGTLHGVELKRANIEDLVTGHRNHLIPGPKVHEAVCQAINYLRELDEHRSQILTDLGIDCRRASMTVVIGHSRFVGGDVTTKKVDETIRTYNSDHSRVSVTTYDRLIENAQRALDLTSPPR